MGGSGLDEDKLSSWGRGEDDWELFESFRASAGASE